MSGGHRSRGATRISKGENMFLFVTDKQYALVNRVLPIMADLHRNRPLPLFHLIAEEYNLTEDAAEKATEIISNLHITAANPVKAMELEQLYSFWTQKTQKVQNEPFGWRIEISEKQKNRLAQTLDAFSRIVMGRFHILFEVLDVPDDFQTNKYAMQMFHDVYWTGAYGAKEARDLLFPQISDFGWNGGYGIANQNVAEISRLAYQMAKALNKEMALPVTKEPIAQVESS